MSELRWHPLLRQWVSVAAHRQGRPQMPAGWCPFCPGSGRVPQAYDVFVYPNDFPAFSPAHPSFAPSDDLFAITGARGASEVLLYHSDHSLIPAALPAAHWRKVAALWSERYSAVAAGDAIEYIHIFENAGEAIGVTMPHPHGQLYGMPFVPPLVETELASAREWHARHGECLYCRLLDAELAGGRRIVAENPAFVAFVPFAARFPAEIQICARRHFGALPEATAAELDALAAIVKLVRMKYDNLFGFPMPLMMNLRQSPTRGRHPYFHFHIDFLPVQRDATKLKYLAGAESGSGVFLNDTVAEERAERLRQTSPYGLDAGST